jgi:hypothetical protein
MSIYKIHKLKKKQVICSENSSGNSHRDEISRSHTIVSRSAVHTPSCRDQPFTHHRVEISRSDTIVSRSAVHTPSCRDQPFTHHRVEISRSHTIVSRSAVHTPSCRDQPFTHHRVKISRAHTIRYYCAKILYNYHPCWSVTRRFVSKRKVWSPESLPEGDLTFRGETNHRITL